MLLTLKASRAYWSYAVVKTMGQEMVTESKMRKASPSARCISMKTMSISLGLLKNSTDSSTVCSTPLTVIEGSTSEMSR